MARDPKKQVATLTHDQARRKNLPTAEFQSVMAREEKSPIRVAYERRNLDLDPQLVWRGKDEQDRSDLVVHAPPLYIQEKVKPKALIDDLQRQSESRAQGKKDHQFSMDSFFDFNGLPDGVLVTDFYQHDAHWTNRMILGDSLQVMASLAEREGLRGKVQCIYLDPPYGIKFNSNFQWSTTSRDVKDGNRELLLADSPEGQKKEAAVSRTVPSMTPTHGDIRQGFVYERVPHITLKSIANNAEIDVIWEKHQEKLEPLRHQLNAALQTAWEEWEIPREVSEKWSDAAKKLHAEWWKQRIARQKEIDACIAAKAEFEYLYDKPYEDKSKVRVAGSFTVETSSPHRVLTVDQDDNLVDFTSTRPEYDFASVILENLKTAGVQQAHKENKITFTALTGWPGHYLCAEGRFMEGEKEKRAGIFIGPEFGTVTRENLIAAARETLGCRV